MNSFTKKQISLTDKNGLKIKLNWYKSGNIHGFVEYDKNLDQQLDEYFQFSMVVASESMWDGYWNGGYRYSQYQIDYQLKKFNLPEIPLSLFDMQSIEKVEHYKRTNKQEFDNMKYKTMAYLRKIRRNLPDPTDTILIETIDKFANIVITSIAFDYNMDVAVIVSHFISDQYDSPVSFSVFGKYEMSSPTLKYAGNTVPLFITSNDFIARRNINHYLTTVAYDELNQKSWWHKIEYPINAYIEMVTMLILSIHHHNVAKEHREFEFSENGIFVLKNLMDIEPINPDAEINTHVAYMDYVNCIPSNCKLPFYEFPCATVSEAKRIYPQFEFSKSEDRFVDKYCSDLIERNNYILNFKKYLGIFRFGNSIWFRCRSVSEKVLFGEFNVLQSNDKGELDIHITEVINDSCLCTINVRLNNIEYVSPKSIMAWNKQIHYINKNDIMGSCQFIEIASDLMKVGLDEVQSLVMWMMCLQIVCVERPQRTRMIREVKYLNGDPTDTSDENVYLISRILRPVKEAKEYMNERGSTPEQRKRGPYIYTVAEWERVGHWRTTKSGKKVWIEPQICHRKDGITKEYVKVKL